MNTGANDDEEQWLQKLQPLTDVSSLPPGPNHLPAENAIHPNLRGSPEPERSVWPYCMWGEKAPPDLLRGSGKLSAMPSGSSGQQDASRSEDAMLASGNGGDLTYSLLVEADLARMEIAHFMSHLSNAE